MKFYTKTKHFIKNNKWWTALMIVIIFIVCYFVFGRSNGTAIETVTVGRDTLVQEVSATGNVTPLSDIDLAFQTGGEVSNLAVSVGDTVTAGEYLASLSNADLSAAVEQAKAALAAANANLAILQSGSTPQTIAVSQAQVAKAQNDLAESQDNLVDVMQDAYTKSDDAIRNDTDTMFNNPDTTKPTLQFQADPQLVNDINNARPIIESILDSWNASTTNLTDATSTMIAANLVSTNLNTIKSFLDNLALAINAATPSGSISQTMITTWKTNVSAARSEVDLAISNFSAATTAYQSDQSALTIAQNQLTLAETPATSDQIAAQQAAVDEAQANVDEAQAELAQSVITSPIDGVVTNVVPSVGETVQSGATAISVISYGDYEVDAYIPESDIANVAIGDTATTTLDAYGSEVFFQMQVIKIDPAETVIEGVPTYKVTLSFITNDSRIKSGMTANLDILTDVVPNALAVPERSVYSDNNEQFVQFVDPKNPTQSVQKVVTTGIRSVDGYIQIISGLAAGDEIVASPNYNE